MAILAPSFLTFDWIFLSLAVKEDMHKSLDELKLPPDMTKDYGISCP